MKILYTTILIFLTLHVSAAAPTVPASNLYFAIVDGGYFNMGWTAGNGAKRIIVCKAGSPVTFIPQNGIEYTANTAFGSGQQPLPGEFIIYNSAFTSFYVTALSPATQYYFAVFEYNGSGVTTEYLTSNFLTANAATSAVPTVQVSNAAFANVTNNSVNVTWTSGNGQRCLIVVREGAAVNADPVNSQPYAVSSVFGSGATTGADNYTVYSSTGTNTSVTGLKAGTTYYFAFYEFNGSGQPQYKVPGYTTSVTTRSIPTVAASAVTITKTDGKELSLSWTNGNGQRRIVIARKGADITGVPANGTNYTANGAFGAGAQLAPGEFVVFNDNFNITTITGLDPASVYFFKIFEYDGTGVNTSYLTATFGAVSGSTAVTPAAQASGITVSNGTANSLNLSFAAGSGRARLVIARQGAPVNVVPQDFTVYNANGIFGSGQDLGNGNFVVRSGSDEYATIQQLQPNTVYHFAVFEYNGFNQPLYLSPAAVFSATTLSALPVKLSQWSATAGTGKVTLQWTTTSEINSSHFIIERSSDGVQFATIATVPAAGNSGVAIQYSKEDTQPTAGKNFYRLKMIDKDGYTEYSPVLTVLINTTTGAHILRNPVQQTLEIVTPGVTNGNDHWQMVNAGGQVIKKGRLATGIMQVSVEQLPKGTYWLQLYNSSSIKVLPFIKL